MYRGSGYAGWAGFAPPTPKGEEGGSWQFAEGRKTTDHGRPTTERQWVVGSRQLAVGSLRYADIDWELSLERLARLDRVEIHFIFLPAIIILEIGIDLRLDFS